MSCAKREKGLRSGWTRLLATLALPTLTLLWSCSATTIKNVAVEPPAELLAPCPYPEGELDALSLLRSGELDKAAKAHAQYVLNVRDAVDLCNSKFSAIDQFYQNLRE